MAQLFTLQDEVLVRAPIERCFLLSTSVALVQRELGMKPVRGRTSGLVIAGDTVRWEGWQLWLPQYHESLIEPFEPPVFFRDRMIAGRFASFQHDHNFIDRKNGNILLMDEVRFAMPLGRVGALVGQTIMVPHIRDLMRRRFALLKQLAETEGWREYLPELSRQTPAVRRLAV